MNPKQQNLSFYINARDNYGSKNTVQSAIDLVKQKGLYDVTTIFRTQYLPPYQDATNAFEFYKNTITDEWKIFDEKRKRFLYLQKLNDAKKISDEQLNEFVALKGWYKETILQENIKKALLLEKDYKAKKEAYDEYKQTRFPAVTWSALLKKRSSDEKFLQEHTGLICIDIDKLQPDKLTGLKKLLQHDNYVFFLFTSPSGTGLKIIIKTSTDAKEHLAYFNALETYFLQEYGLPVDVSGKDISRLCFLCCDVDCFYNSDSVAFVCNTHNNVGAVQTKEQKKVAKLTKKEETTFVDTDAELKAVEYFTNNKMVLSAGNRNNWIYLFACNCNRKGIDASDCLNYVYALVGDKDIKEVAATVQSGYKHHPHETGKYAKKNNSSTALPAHEKTNKVVQQNAKNTQPEISQQAAQKNDAQPNQNKSTGKHNGVEDYNAFWYESINEKTGKTTLHIKYEEFYNFLNAQGFANLMLEDGKSVELIHVLENIVRPVFINDMRNDIKAHLNRFCREKKLYSVLEMLHRGQKNYFNRGQFINLEFKKIDFIRDTAEVSYHFHSNCVVEVRAEGITTREYKTGEKAIWQTLINPRPFTRKKIQTVFNPDDRIAAANTDCEFAKFQILASCHPDNNVTADVANKRFLAHATSFGFLINNYKGSKGIAVVGVDHHKSADRSEQNGRTGKGILSKAIGAVTKRFPVDGRKFDPRDQSVFENLTMDARVITVDDCNERFDFGHFFVPITEDFTLRKMYMGYITIPYMLSPKWYFNTNFSFRGDGDSFNARQHIIEFDNYFNKNYSPFDEFKHSLFLDWNEEQWNLFYNYAYECDALHKIMGLVEYPEGNYLERKLMNECPEEFIDWCDAFENETYTNIPRNKELVKLQIFGAWNEHAKQYRLKEITAHTFTKWIKKYCNTRGLIWHSSKPGGVEKYLIKTTNINQPVQAQLL